jgi:hypothetical protein
MESSNILMMIYGSTAISTNDISSNIFYLNIIYSFLHISIYSNTLSPNIFFALRSQTPWICVPNWKRQTKLHSHILSLSGFNIWYMEQDPTLVE